MYFEDGVGSRWFEPGCGDHRCGFCGKSNAETFERRENESEREKKKIVH